MSLLLAIVAIVVGLLIVRQYPDGARRVMLYILTIRRVVFGALLILAAAVLLGTGNFFYMLIGFSIFVGATVYVALEDPRKEVKSWLTS